jgi:ketosteroid isomerase-like protein
MSRFEQVQALQDLMARYTDAANRRDAEAWASTWTGDAEWHLLGNVVQGREAIVGLWSQVMQSLDFALLLPSSSHFDFHGSDSASGYWYLHEYTRDAHGNGSLMLSRYSDRYAREDGEWRYHCRRYDILYRGKADLSGDYTPFEPR